MGDDLVVDVDLVVVDDNEYDVQDEEEDEDIESVVTRSKHSHWWEELADDAVVAPPNELRALPVHS